MRDTDPWSAVRTSYDSTAGHYSTLVLDDLDRQPVERGLLSIFAELASGGRVADVGCGPGQITHHLHRLGLDVFGVDLSPGMIEQARKNFPELDLEVGSMAELSAPGGSLSGVVAWLSTIHFPDDQLPGVLEEFHRVLAVGAPVLMTFQVGDGPKHFEQLWGGEVDLTVYRRRPEVLADQLRSAGFHVLMSTVFEPVGRPGAQAGCMIGLRT
ncbi:class I SAM-dependent methyltransferase [Kineosporia mesophila]|uniref:Class I SAM-dependent methyltransferase n=1 Tax=Kineosporia mesophila TaxID=566012 RepID=A0ABP6YS95_9ACTN|nr:methyltransferase domain-containing protein [Kineosporia mesophila]